MGLLSSAKQAEPFSFPVSIHPEYNMASEESLEAMRTRIVQTEQQNAARRDKEFGYPPLADVQVTVDGDHELPDLPPLLPRPQYALEPYLISQAIWEVYFYVACEQGQMPRVTSLAEEYNPSQAILQFGLEQASFGNQPAVARYLLEKGTILHDNAFLRCEFGQELSIFDRARDDPIALVQAIKAGQMPKDKETSIFDRGREDPIALVQVYLDFGWHPNQLWHGNQVSENAPKQPLVESLANKPLLTLLLSHGADPHISHHNVGLFDYTSLSRRSGSTIDFAIWSWDHSLLALLIENGAKTSYTRPLHEAVRPQGLSPLKIPFSERRPMVEYLISSGISQVDEIKSIVFNEFIASPRPTRTEDLTAFVYACAAQDYEMAEWLLEHGADPYVLGRKAFQPLWYMGPYLGPSDPNVVKALVEKVKNRRE